MFGVGVPVKESLTKFFAHVVKETTHALDTSSDGLRGPSGSSSTTLTGT